MRFIARLRSSCSHRWMLRAPAPERLAPLSAELTEMAGEFGMGKLAAEGYRSLDRFYCPLAVHAAAMLGDSLYPGLHTVLAKERSEGYVLMLLCYDSYPVLPAERFFLPSLDIGSNKKGPRGYLEPRAQHAWSLEFRQSLVGPLGFGTARLAVFAAGLLLLTTIGDICGLRTRSREYHDKQRSYH
jgi:hypothetical protein